MSDPNLPPPGAADAPLIVASNFVVSSNIAEFYLLLNYTAHDRARREFVTRTSYAVTTAPQAAVQLYEMLGNALADYEHRFGKIPREPGAIVGPNGRPVDAAPDVVQFPRRAPSANGLCPHNKPLTLPCAACSGALREAREPLEPEPLRTTSPRDEVACVHGVSLHADCGLCDPSL